MLFADINSLAIELLHLTMIYLMIYLQLQVYFFKLRHIKFSRYKVLFIIVS